MTDAAEVQARLRRIEGQTRGLQKMLADERPYEEVITQFMAVRAALDKVGIQLVSQHIQECARRHREGAPCEGELERALGMFLRMETARPGEAMLLVPDGDPALEIERPERAGRRHAVTAAGAVGTDK